MGSKEIHGFKRKSGFCFRFPISFDRYKNFVSKECVANFIVTLNLKLDRFVIVSGKTTHGQR
jgi:hypothetical protein